MGGVGEACEGLVLVKLTLNLSLKIKRETSDNSFLEPPLLIL